jgi:tetratricopeptide (TPR) repeat protein
VTGATLHVECVEDVSTDDIARNLLALAALAFQRVGQSLIAGRLAHVYLADSSMADDLEAVMSLASAMADARQIRAALELAEALDRRGEDASNHSFAMTLVPMVHSASLSPGEADLHVATLQARIKRRITRGDRTEAASVAVTLGNVLGHRAEYDRAIAAFDKALRLDPAYAERAHFHNDRAGHAFWPDDTPTRPRATHGRWRSARRASRKLSTPTLSSFAGRYAEAELALVAFLVGEEPDERTSEYILKRVLGSRLAARGLVRQVRRTSEAVRLAAGVAKANSTVEARDLCESAIQADGLCGLAWCNLAVALRELGDPGAATAFLGAAVIMEGDPEMWAEALLTPGARAELDLYVLLTARRMTAGAVSETMATAARRNGNVEFLARLPGSSHHCQPRTSATRRRSRCV